MKTLLFLMGALLCTNINAGVDVKRSNDANYKLGTHLEAEAYAEGLTKITNNTNASNGEAIDAGADGSITYTVNMEEEGNYRLAVGYYSGSSTAKISVKVNDGTLETYNLDVLNGWCKINLFHKFLTFWWGKVKGYTDEQMLPIILEGKKKLPLTAHWMIMAYSSDMRMDAVKMTKTEAEQFRAELISVAKQLSSKNSLATEGQGDSSSV